MAIYTISAVLVMIACLLLILIVLVQNSKGGGLASNFSSSNQVMGVRKTTDFLEKATWVLAVAILVLSMVASLSVTRPEVQEDSRSRLYDQYKGLDPSKPTSNIPPATTTPPPTPSNNAGTEDSE